MTLDNFRLAFKKAKKGRSTNQHVKKILGRRRRGESKEDFKKRRQKRIDRYMRWLMRLVDSGKYTTSEYETRVIKDPKERTLYILPLWPDRIVQHAMVNVLQPIWNKLLIHHTYACRIDKGQHKCSAAISYGVKHYKYCGLTDVRKFYPSISHDVMYSVVKKKIKDKKMLELLKDVIYSIDGDTNVPIGNLLSQHLGNLLLNELDQFTAHELKIKLAPRYMDNKAYFSNNLQKLKADLDKAEKFLNEKLKLQLSQKEIKRCDNGIEFIGYRHFPDYILLKKRTAKRFRKKIKKLPGKLERKTITLVHYTSVLASLSGWAGHANAYNFRQSIGLNRMLEDAQKQIKEVKMRGFPKYTDITTKQDVENVRALFPKETKKFLETIKNDRFIWVDTGKLTDDEGVTDDTHRVDSVQVTDTDGGISTEKHQFELIEDTNARIFRMGYTVNQVEELIEKLS